MTITPAVLAEQWGVSESVIEGWILNGFLDSLQFGDHVASATRTVSRPTLRPSTPYGPGRPPKSQSLLADMVATALRVLADVRSGHRLSDTEADALSILRGYVRGMTKGAPEGE